MFGEQMKRRRGFDFENRDGLAAIGAFAMIKRGTQFIVGDKNAATYFSEPKPLVETHQMRRRIDMDPQTRSFENRAQERDRRTFAVGARDMDDRRDSLFRVIQTL